MTAVEVRNECFVVVGPVESETPCVASGVAARLSDEDLVAKTVCLIINYLCSREVSWR